MSDIYETIAAKIIREQVGLIGPIAIQVASKVDHLKVGKDATTVSIDDNNKSAAIDALIGRFETLFGTVSVEVSRDAVKTELHELPAGAVPHRLQ